MFSQNLIAAVIAALKSVEATNLPTMARALEAQAFKSILPSAILKPLRRDVMTEAPGMLCECISMCFVCLLRMTYGGDLADSPLNADSSLGVEIDGAEVFSGGVVALVDELVVVCLLLGCIGAWDKALHAADNVLENITLLNFLGSLALLIRGRDDRVKERGDVILFS